MPHSNIVPGEAARYGSRVGVGAAYPFDRWPRLTRSEARLASQLARAIDAIDGDAAIADLRAVLGATVSIGARQSWVTTTDLIARDVGESAAMITSIGSQRSVLALAPGIARVIADRVVGGTGADVALGPTPLSRGEMGLVAYVVARAMREARAPGSLVDVAKARDAIITSADRVVVVFAELVIGDARGAAWAIVPLAAIDSLPRTPAAIDPALRVGASIVIGAARLSARDIATLTAGDIVIPDVLSIDPRSATAGRARLVVARSSRTFELELSLNEWRIASVTSLPSLRAPLSFTHRKKESMSQPEIDTLQSLADVEVELSIELARLDMPVAEVAALAPGVVITTGRLVGERVALRAGDRVIAWGELIDVEGEVGVRLTEVAAHG